MQLSATNCLQSIRMNEDKKLPEELRSIETYR